MIKKWILLVAVVFSMCGSTAFAKDKMVGEAVKQETAETEEKISIDIDDLNAIEISKLNGIMMEYIAGDEEGYVYTPEESIYLYYEDEEKIEERLLADAVRVIGRLWYAENLLVGVSEPVFCLRGEDRCVVFGAVYYQGARAEVFVLASASFEIMDDGLYRFVDYWEPKEGLVEETLRLRNFNIFLDEEMHVDSYGDSDKEAVDETGDTWLSLNDVEISCLLDLLDSKEYYESLKELADEDDGGKMARVFLGNGTDDKVEEQSGMHEYLFGRPENGIAEWVLETDADMIEDVQERVD